MNKEEKEARYLINVLEDKKFTAQGEALRTYIEELNKNIDKLLKENEALGRTLDDEIADNDRLQENNLSYQEELAKAWKENAELKEEIKDLIEENHKHIDYIADMKKKHEDKKKADMNKLINYIAVKENKDFEEVCEEFEV